MAKQKIRDDSLYTCFPVSPTVYKITKFNSDAEFQSAYEVIQTSPRDLFCTCLGFHHRSNCRHLDIFRRFREEGLLTKGCAYNFKDDSFTKMLEDIES